MDLQALTALFATTYNADPNIQKAGELQIRKVRRSPCSCVVNDPDPASSLRSLPKRACSPPSCKSSHPIASICTFPATLPYHVTQISTPSSSTRQACSVYLKNRVHTSYRVDIPGIRPERGPIAQSDCDALKLAILRVLASSPSRMITVQLATALKDMIARDFPDRWPGLLDSVSALLNSGDIREVGAGCVAALECVRAFG